MGAADGCPDARAQDMEDAMKTSPTDVDREAARLFNPAPGMRVRAKMRDAEDSFW